MAISYLETGTICFLQLILVIIFCLVTYKPAHIQYASTMVSVPVGDAAT